MKRSQHDRKMGHRIKEYTTDDTDATDSPEYFYHEIHETHEKRRKIAERWLFSSSCLLWISW
jgi:hypothetical protein